MSIEKKSLISNRMATKKAIIAKPEVTKVESAKLLGKARVMPVNRIKPTHISTAYVRPSRVR